jgi:hypothetical protein
MLKKRDAQGLSTSVIILAVLGLIILFALLYMFLTEQGKTSKTLVSCIAKGGKCVLEGECEDGKVLPDVKCKQGSGAPVTGAGAIGGTPVGVVPPIVCCIKI